MAKRLIEGIKVGQSKGGIACGPVSGSIVVELKLRNTEDNSVNYYAIVETESIPTLLESEESLYDLLIEEDYEDESKWAKVEEAQVGGYMAYGEFYESLKDPACYAEEDVPLWKSLIFFTRAGWDEVEEMKPKFIGKHLDEVEIPVCDAEEEYLEDYEE